MAMKVETRQVFNENFHVSACARSGDRC